MDLSQELSALQTDLKGFVTKAAEEKTQFGSMLAETKTSLDAIQKQIDSIDLKMVSKTVGEHAQPFSERLKENDDVARLLKNRRGSATITLKSSDFQRKTIVAENGTGTDLGPVGSMTTGVLQIDRISGITQEARQELRIRDLLVSRPTTLSLVDFVKVGAPPAAGTMTAEGNAITENAVSFTSASERIRTIATFIPATKQILDDYQELAGYIQTALPYYVNLEEELQMLSGDATGENLHGLITQASAYSTTFNATGDTKIDTIGHAITQIAEAKELKPTFIVLNIGDWWSIRLTKDNYGRYLLGDPQSNVEPSLFGVPVVPTVNMTAGSFLVGSGAAPAAEIRDRMDMQVEISTEHADYFARNLVAIRAEKRLALVVKRPGAFVTGTFPTVAAS